MSCEYIFIPIPGPIGPGGQSSLSGGTGYTGPTGIQGVQGPTGLGLTGPAGNASLTGATGPQGPTGLGFTGPAGTASGTGATGPTGAQGFTGPAGTSSLTGATGPQGPTGLGLTGPAGSSSLTGATGPQGQSGTSVTGPTGRQGATGAQGVQGVTGPASAASPTFAYRAVYMGYDNGETIDVQILNALYYGFNLIILAFWLPSTNAPDPFSGLDKWSALSGATKTYILNTAHTLNAHIIMSVGGATETGVFALNPTTVSTNASNYAIAQSLDGIDYDLEGINVGFTATGQPTSAALLSWFQTLNTNTRSILGVNRLITHAPQSPYLCPAWVGPSNGYYQVYANNPDIDALLVQYYNQTAQYNSYTTIFRVGPSDFPLSAVEQIHNFTIPIPLNKIVVGTFLQYPGDGSLLPNIPLQWHTWVNQAYSDFGFNSGLMTWQYHPTGAPNAQTWVQTIFPQV